MSRFFKSAAFPILIVVVLAFLAVKLVNPGSNNHHPHSYQTLVATEIPNHEVSSVQFKNKGKALEVKYRNKETAEFGFIDQAAPELIKELRTAGIKYNVESEKSLHHPVRPLLRVLDLHHEPGPGRRFESDVLRQVARQAPVG
jgi:cell division protease FtsH